MKTNLRPDAVLVSQQSKTLVAIELSVPWEENFEEAHERKSLKYADLMVDCKDKGWSVWLFPVEVGCRRFPAQSVWKLLTGLGISGRNMQDNMKKTGRSSRSILLDMTPPRRSVMEVGIRRVVDSATTADPPTGVCHG